MTQYINYSDQEYNIINIIKNHNVFLTGIPGSGKTHVTLEYIKYLYDNNITCGITASTGIASKLLNNISVLGTKYISTSTIHSWSGIDIIEKDDTLEKVIDRVMKKPFVVKNPYDNDPSI